MACKFICRINKRNAKNENGQSADEIQSHINRIWEIWELRASKCEMRVIMYVCEYYN